MIRSRKIRSFRESCRWGQRSPTSLRSDGASCIWQIRRPWNAKAAQIMQTHYKFFCCHVLLSVAFVLSCPTLSAYLAKIREPASSARHGTTALWLGTWTCLRANSAEETQINLPK